MKPDKNYTEILPEQTTNDDGNARFKLPLEKFKQASYSLGFSAEAFEAEGGRSVKTYSHIRVSPLKYLVGYRADDSLSYVKKDAVRTVNVIAVNPKMTKIPVADLKLHTIEKKYVSVLTETSRGTMEYVSKKKEVQVGERQFSIGESGSDVALDTTRPGTFFVSVRDGAGIELARVDYSVAASGNVTRSLERNAQLEVKINKSDYNPGETIELSIQAPYVGAGLITVEREKVYAHRWFKATTTATVQRIKLPSGIEGNAYVSVSFVRDVNSKEIFMSPTSFAAVPFSISKEKRHNKITLSAADLVKPNETLEVQYRSKRPGKVIIFAVNEGILQVAGYANPDPLSFYFQKRALEVDTYQILSLLLPEHRLLVDRSTTGGGMFARKARASEMLADNLNPFQRKVDKPVAFWSGLLDSGPEYRKWTFDIPDYFNGELRLIAVAVSQGSVGAAAKKTVVRGDLIVSPNLPFFAAPGDTFRVSAAVANNIVGETGNEVPVSVLLKTSDHLQITSDKQVELKIPPYREAVATFDIKVLENLGSATFDFSAASGDKSAARSLDISLRPLNPYEVTVNTDWVKPGAKKDVPLVRTDMYEEFRTLTAEASHAPVALLGGLLKYLEKFPYGCTEQVISRAFPLLILSNVSKWDFAGGQLDKNVNGAISKVQARQHTGGGFGFWSANSNVLTFPSLYALDFLMEARRRNFPVAEQAIEKGRHYLIEMLRNKPKSLYELRHHAYAIYLLTKHGTVTSKQIKSLRENIDKVDDKRWQDDLTAIYLAMSYALLKDTREANKLFSKIDLDQPIGANYSEFYYPMMRESMYLLALTEHFKDRISSFNFKRIENMLNLLNGGYNTVSAAHFAFAIAVYVNLAEQGAVNGFRILEEVANQLVAIEKGSDDPAKIAFSPQASKLRFDNTDDLPLFFSSTQAGFDRLGPTKEVQNKIQVQRTFTKNGAPLQGSVKIGDEIEVRLKLRSVDRGVHPHVAVVDLAPGGFEPVISSVRSRSCKITEGMGHFSWSNVDVREDRVLVFGTVSNKSQEYCYRIKAVNTGNFQVPPAFARSMYNRSVWSKGVAGSIVVEK